MNDRFHPYHTLHHRNTNGGRGFAWGEGSTSSPSSSGGTMMNEDTSAREEQLHQTRGMVVVPGVVSADALVTGTNTGRDGDPPRSNGYVDAAQALLGGLAKSSTPSKAHHKQQQHSNGNGAGAWQSSPNRRAGVKGDFQQQPDRQPSYLKDHNNDGSFMSGFGTLVRSTRRLVNSYWSTVARQQRERSRRMSKFASSGGAATAAAAGGIEETDVLLEGTVHGGEGLRTSGGGSSAGGGMHRSQSSILVGHEVGSPIGRVDSNGILDGAPLEIELVDMEAGLGVQGFHYGEFAGGGGDAVARVPATEAGDGTGGGRGHLRRGSRASATTGDLIRLLRDEEQGQGAGEDSAQEDRNGAHVAQVNHKAGYFGLGGKSLSQSTSMSRHSVSNVEQWKRDAWADRSFKVLGVEIGHLPESQQFFVCAGGVFTFLLVYGYMQEYLAIGIFNRKLGLFLTLLQFFGYAACAALRRTMHREEERRISMSTYWGLGFLQACMQGLTNVSMMYLNYPAKVLFKSSRMVPIMCFGVVWQSRKYSWRDYCVVFMIVTGLATFMNAETRASEASATPFSVLGVVCISLALVVDAAIINVQEEVMNRYDSCQDELIMFSYLCGAVYVAAACLLTGDLGQGLLFLHEKGLWAVLALILFSGAGFLGASCAAALTKRFGALHSAITTTARKAVTLMLSFIVFPNKPFSVQHGVGAAVFILGLVTKVTGKKGPSNTPTGPSASASPGATPFVRTRGRKHLPVSKDNSDMFDTSNSASPLISGGSGGASCNAGGHGTNGSGGGVDRTHSPSPVGPEGSATVTGNAGGHPVRHRGFPKAVPNGDGNAGGGDGSISNGKTGRGVRRSRTFEGVAGERQTPSRSPHRRAQSPPVTGLAMRAQV